MTASRGSQRADALAKIAQTSGQELDTPARGDVASISDELTDALQAASCYFEIARLIGADKYPVLDKWGRDVLGLARDQIQRANRAVKNLHCNLVDRDRS